MALRDTFIHDCGAFVSWGIIVPLITSVSVPWISITAAGALLWNGSPVNTAQLRQYLEVSQQMDPLPELHLQPEPNARYETVDQVLAITKQARVEKMGFVGNEQYANF